MTITINRRTTNTLYTMGALCVNGIPVSYTLEATGSKLPVGTYIVRIIKKSERKQDICIIPKTQGLEPSPISKFTIGHSWKSASKISVREHLHFSSVLIGNVLTPGVMYKSEKDIERLTDRLMKCILRNEAIDLVVTEANVVETTPTALWR